MGSKVYPKLYAIENLIRIVVHTLLISAARQQLVEPHGRSGASKERVKAYDQLPQAAVAQRARQARGLLRLLV